MNKSLKNNHELWQADIWSYHRVTLKTSPISTRKYWFFNTYWFWHTVWCSFLCGICLHMHIFGFIVLICYLIHDCIVFFVFYLHFIAFSVPFNVRWFWTRALPQKYCFHSYKKVLIIVNIYYSHPAAVPQCHLLLIQIYTFLPSMFQYHDNANIN